VCSIVVKSVRKSIGLCTRTHARHELVQRPDRLLYSFIRMTLVAAMQKEWAGLSQAWFDYQIDREMYERKQFEFSRIQFPDIELISMVSLICTQKGIQLFSRPSFAQGTRLIIPREGDIVVGFVTLTGHADLRLTCGGHFLNRVVLQPGRHVLALKNNCVPILSLHYQELALCGRIPDDLQVIYGVCNSTNRLTLALNSWNVGKHCFSQGVYAGVPGVGVDAFPSVYDVPIAYLFDRWVFERRVTIMQRAWRARLRQRKLDMIVRLVSRSLVIGNSI